MLFKMVWTTKALPHLMDDFRIGAALLNTVKCQIEFDGEELLLWKPRIAIECIESIFRQWRKLKTKSVN